MPVFPGASAWTKGDVQRQTPGGRPPNAATSASALSIASFSQGRAQLSFLQACGANNHIGKGTLARLENSLDAVWGCTQNAPMGAES